MIICRDIVNLPFGDTLTLRGGAGGLSRPISWMHYLEDPSYVKWIKGGEMVIVSGVVTKARERELIMLVRKLHAAGAAGIIINLSYYIHEIPQSVIVECDRLSFPLFEMPAKVRIVDISQSVCYAIFREREREMGYRSLLDELLFGKRITERRVQAAKAAGFHPGMIYHVVTLRVTEGTETEPGAVYGVSHPYDEVPYEAVPQCVERLSSDYVETRHIKVLHTLRDEDIVLVLPAPDGFDVFLNEMKQLIDYLSECLPGYRFHAAVGIRFAQLDGLKESFDSAISLFCAGNGIENNQILDYREKLLERILWQVHNKKMVRSIADRLLAPVLNHANDALFNTLREYCLCGGNVTLAAQHLFVHSNTLYRRLQHIERLLSQDLHDPDVFFTLSMAVRMHDYAREDLD